MINNILLRAQPPYSILAEELVIGSLLLTLDYHIYDTIDSHISVDALMLESHQIVYTLILVKRRSFNVSLSGLIYSLSQEGVLRKIGGMNKILELINQVSIFRQLETSTVDINSCIDIIREKYIRRLLLQWSVYIAQIGISESVSINFSLKLASNYLKKIYQLLQQQDRFDVSDVVRDLLNGLELSKSSANRSDTLGLKSGFRELDRMTRGFQPSDLIIIAGRPAMGKTSIALNVTNYILHQTGRGVIIFSFEMSKQQILYRLLSIQCKISVHQLRSGLVNTAVLTSIKENCRVISQSFLYVDDSPQISVFTLYLKTKKIIEKYNQVGIVIIDYLQLLLASNLRFESRAQEVSSITRMLKVLAREIELPVIVLSQLNRNVESRTNKRPLLSDLRESGCIQSTMEITVNSCIFVIRVIQSIFYFRCLIYSVRHRQQLCRNCLATISCQGIHHTYIIYMKFSRFLDITYNHKILTFIGWKREESLRATDKSITIYDLIKNKGLDCQLFIYKSLSFIRWGQNQLVYDVKTNRLTNFAVNQVIVHNSIEQDADLVLLLYREDYYTGNSICTKIAEVILAKHRNGPTGSFQLNFDSLSTAFSDDDFVG